jgi:hypothetical protein
VKHQGSSSNVMIRSQPGAVADPGATVRVLVCRDTERVEGAHAVTASSAAAAARSASHPASRSRSSLRTSRYSGQHCGARRITSALRSSIVPVRQQPTVSRCPASVRARVAYWSSEPIGPTVRTWRGASTRALPETQALPETWASPETRALSQTRALPET